MVATSVPFCSKMLSTFMAVSPVRPIIPRRSKAPSCQKNASAGAPAHHNRAIAFYGIATAVSSRLSGFQIAAMMIATTTAMSHL